jgi:hypothetical protein
MALFYKARLIRESVIKEISRLRGLGNVGTQVVRSTSGSYKKHLSNQEPATPIETLNLTGAYITHISKFSKHFFRRVVSKF